MNTCLPLLRFRSSLFRLWAALLLATIAVQAAQPFTAPRERDHGPAFSAASAEVALTVPRRTETARAALPLEPVLPPDTRPLPAPSAPALVALPLLRPDSSGPPARAILIRQPAPRAPPLT